MFSTGVGTSRRSRRLAVTTICDDEAASSSAAFASGEAGSVVADGAIWACATEGARAAPMTSAAVPLRSHPADEPRRRSGCVVQLMIAYANTLPRRLIAFPHLLLRQGVLHGESCRYCHNSNERCAERTIPVSTRRPE